MKITISFLVGGIMSIRKYIGDRSFYRSVLSIALPIMIQNGIMNFVSLLDNIMVGRLSTEAMSGVSIVNQFIFIFNLLVFGATSAAGIFTAQYHGFGDTRGVRDTFRFKFLICTVSAILGIAVFALLGNQCILLFLHDGSAEGDLALTLAHGHEYLTVMLFGLIPYALSNVYASTLRETGETVPPMAASIAAVIVNFVLNYLLIFGSFGMPRLGVVGAAIATVISRFVELTILILWTATHTDRCPYIVGAFRSMRIPRALIAQITIRGLPLMLNELLWSIAMTMRNQCYSTRGLDVVAAQNISSTITNLFNVIYLSLGTAVAIIIGNLLGAGKIEEAKETEHKLSAFSVVCAIGVAALLCLCAPFFPKIYNTTDSVRAIAAYMIIVYAATTPFCAYSHAAYFTLRSGGQVFVTMLSDSVFMWVIVMPIALCLANLSPISIFWLFAICQGTEIPKALFGALLIRRGSWLKQLVGKEQKEN